MSYDEHFASVSLLLHMDGASNSTIFLDGSLTPKTVVRSGDAKVSTVQSKFGGSSLYLDGAGDYLSLDGSAGLALDSNDYTIELFAYCTNLSSPRVLFDFRPQSTPGWYPYAYIDSTNIVYHLNSSDRITAAHGISINTWVHLAIVRFSGTTKTYVNGVAVGSAYTDSSAMLVGSGRPIIGAAGVSLGAFPFVGYIDEFRITKGVARYTADFTPPDEPFANRGPRVVGKIRDVSGSLTSRTVRAYRRDTGVLLGSTVPRATQGDAQWRNTSLLLHMDGANDSTSFIDSSLTQKTVSPNGNVRISTAESKFGGSSAYFDGTGDYLQVATSADLAFGTADFSLEGWFKVTNFASQRTLFDFRPIDNNGAYVFLAIRTTGALMLYVGAADRIVSAASSVPINEWAHIACCRSAGTTRLFVNGAVVGTPWTDSTNYLVGSIFGCRIGRTSIVSYSEELLGYADEIRITKGFARYTANFTPPSAPFDDYDDSAEINEYVIETGSYTGEVNVICLDDDAGTLERDMIHRAFPV